MKKIFAAAALLLAMTACGGSQKEALPLEGTTWKLAKMEAIPAKAIDAEADFFTLQFSAADTLVSGRTNCNRFFAPCRTLRLKRNKSYPGLNEKSRFRHSEAGFSSFCRDPRPPSYAGCHSPEAIPASSRSKNSRSGIP